MVMVIFMGVLCVGFFWPQKIDHGKTAWWLCRGFCPPKNGRKNLDFELREVNDFKFPFAGQRSFQFFKGFGTIFWVSFLIVHTRQAIKDCEDGVERLAMNYSNCGILTATVLKAPSLKVSHKSQCGKMMVDGSTYYPP